jgi:pimeloyl-ACP methyl ester carboxylesterase
MKQANVNGVTLEYEETGSGEPILLICPVVADGFLPLLSEPALVDRYRLITYRKRGWGGSTSTPAPVSIEDHAADAAGLLGHLGLRRAHVVGHSSGAVIALQLVFDRPDLVHSLSLLEPTIFSVPSTAGLLQNAGPAFERYGAGDRESALALFMSAVSGMEWGACRVVLERHVPGVLAQAIEDADTLFGVELPALTRWVCSAEQTAGVHLPVLSVLGSDTGPVWVEVAELLHAWFPQTEDCVIEDAGHLLQLQRPEPVARGLAEFIGRHSLTIARPERATAA